MGKRKWRRMGIRKWRQSQNTQTLNHSNGGEDESRNGRSDDLEEGEKSGFFACYLLTSLCPRFKGHTYIGFTVNPRRRIRQHNGEICSGASRTKKKRPWEMVLCIYGFPTNVAALQFEWAWQHPVESLRVREAAVGFKSLGGLANKIKLAYTMLTLPTWNKLNLNVNFFSTKYTKHYAGCPSLPSHMRVYVRSMGELPCYTEGYKESEEDDMFGFGNDLQDDDVEEEPTSVSANHHSTEEEEPTSVSDNEDFVRPFYTNDLWDDYDEGVEPVLVSPDHQNNEKEKATSVSDTQNLDDSPVWVFSGTPKKSFMDYSGFVSPVIEGGYGQMKGGVRGSGLSMGMNKDGIEIEIPVSSGVVEVDTQNLDDSPVWVLSGTPKKSFMDYSGVVSPVIEDGYGQMKGARGSGLSMGMNKDGIEIGIPVSSGAVEVIDIFSPSPEYRVSSRRKKRSVFVDCPEIIDLSQSPIFV